MTCDPSGYSIRLAQHDGMGVFCPAHHPDLGGRRRTARRYRL